MANNGVFTLLMLLLFFFPASFIVVSATFNHDVDLIWGGDRAKIHQGGRALSLTLDQVSGSGFQSKSTYLFGRVDMEIMLVPGNSAGTVTAYYLSSEGKFHDEIDYEFLGNLSGEPYTVHTNVYTHGRGDREQQFHLWFDPTKSFHLYSIVWNPQRIIFLIDNIPIRVFENEESKGVPYPKKQAMRVYSSLWDADQWATRGGLIKTDWSKAPFTAHYRNFKSDACVCSSSSSCAFKASSSDSSWQNLGLDANGRKKLRWVQKYYMIYNYCSDVKRFPHGRPRECRYTRFF